jgi:hypothetical protein
MVVLLTATISCSQALNILNRLTSVVGLTPQQKVEIIAEVRKSIPFCPIKIIKDDGRNTK